MMPDRTAQAMADEGVTLSAGVPTLWIGLLQVLAQRPDLDLSALNRVVIGGSAVPFSLIQALQAKGIPVLHAWGMTETSPIGTVSRLLARLESLPPEQQIAYQAKQGRVVPGVELRIVDLASGAEVPNDGTTFGEIQVRGPWITGSYYHDANIDQGQEKFVDGWFRTGDVATMDADGYVQIVDRTKDVVKSGGEWILVGDARKRHHGPPAGDGGDGDRAAASQVAGAPDSDRRAEAGGGGPAHRGRYHHLSGAARRQVVAAGSRDLCRGNPEDQRRQVR